MKFLVDAQLPRRLCSWLREAGHDARHTLDLPLGNRAPDSDSVIVMLAENEQRVVITKDGDFVQSHLLSGQPAKLLIVSIGNIDNAELQHLFQANLDAIVSALEQGRFVELGRHVLTLRG